MLQMQGDVFPEMVPARAGAIAENRLFANNAGRGIPRKGKNGRLVWARSRAPSPCMQTGSLC